METVLAVAAGFVAGVVVTAAARRGDRRESALPRLFRVTDKVVSLMRHLDLGGEPPPQGVPSAVADAWGSGDRARAVDLLARQTGMEPAKAKARLQRLYAPALRLERCVDALLVAQGIAVDAADDIPPGVRDAYLDGGKIAAIKVYREVAGVGLKRAKEAVEELIEREGW